MSNNAELATELEAVKEALAPKPDVIFVSMKPGLSDVIFRLGCAAAASTVYDVSAAFDKP